MRKLKGRKIKRMKKMVNSKVKFVFKKNEKFSMKSCVLSLHTEGYRVDTRFPSNITKRGPSKLQNVESVKQKQTHHRGQRILVVHCYNKVFASKQSEIL